MASPSYIDAVMLLGDSITQTWEPGSFAQRIAQYYSRKADVLNRGYGGYNSEGILPCLKGTLATKAEREQGRVQKIKLLTVWMGTNDATIPLSNQHVPPEKFQQNLSQVISVVRSPDSPYYSPETEIVLITPAPIIEVDWTSHVKANRIAEGVYSEPFDGGRRAGDVKKYVEACRSVASQEGLPLLDLYDEMARVAGGFSDEQLRPYYSDGLHLTPLGYQVQFEALVRLIEKELPGLTRDAIPQRVPDYARDKTDLVEDIARHDQRRAQGEI